MDRLGVRQGSATRVEGLEEQAWFANELRERGADLDCGPPHDLVFYMAGTPGDLERLGELRAGIRSNGAIWVVRAKGAARTLTEVDIIEAARRHGLVDNKIASFSDTLAAMRLVIPLALR